MHEELLSYYSADVSTKSSQWSTAEKDALVSAVANRLKSLGDVGNIDWSDISKDISIEIERGTSRKRKSVHSTPGSDIKPPIKSGVECFMMYRNQADPSLNVSPWTKEEDSKLSALASKYNNHEWCLIASELGTHRSPISCLTRFQSVLTSNMSNSSEWTKSEDEMLRNAVRLYGKKWSVVAMDVKGRSAIQCSVRYRKIHCSTTGEAKGVGVRVGKWTRSEEKLLFIAALAHNIPFNTDYKVPTSRIEELVNYLTTTKDTQNVQSERVRMIVTNTSSFDASDPVMKSEDGVILNTTDENSNYLEYQCMVPPEIGKVSEENPPNPMRCEATVKSGAWMAVSKYVPNRLVVLIGACIVSFVCDIGFERLHGFV